MSPVAAPARAGSDSRQYGDMSTTMCDLDVETSADFAAELSPPEPPTDDDDKKLLRQLLELQILWARSVCLSEWSRLWADAPPADAIELAAMSVFTAKLLAGPPPSMRRVRNAYMPTRQ